MKYIIGLLLIIFVLLQARLWTGAGSLAEIVRLENEIETQTAENTTLDSRNQKLKDEVRDLRNGLDSIEERARSELGLIKKGETFFLIVEDEPVVEQPSSAFEDSLVEPVLEMPPEPGPESALDFTSDDSQSDAATAETRAALLDREAAEAIAEPPVLLQTRLEPIPDGLVPLPQNADVAPEQDVPAVNPYLELFRDDDPIVDAPQDDRQ